MEYPNWNSKGMPKLEQLKMSNAGIVRRHPSWYSGVFSRSRRTPSWFTILVQKQFSDQAQIKCSVQVQCSSANEYTSVVIKCRNYYFSATSVRGLDVHRSRAISQLDRRDVAALSFREISLLFKNHYSPYLYRVGFKNL
ncbi:hypothetical protein F511_37406 [Dorcoceras hygrometricum]|uniref:Uncharacterized protein n=1 Tax=Dorcoceras hygrometricum TaxID=472368 RepID=A0A2Z7C1Y1_9LAMI|nr:hypothetical protein F511_37406 [Dorcoceras hygrometricum]